MQVTNDLRRAVVEDAWMVVRYMRNWLHYGVITFAVLCSLIAAVRGAVVPW